MAAADPAGAAHPRLQQHAREARTPDQKSEAVVGTDGRGWDRTPLQIGIFTPPGVAPGVAPHGHPQLSRTASSGLNVEAIR